MSKPQLLVTACRLHVQLLMGLTVWCEGGKECLGISEDLDLKCVLLLSKTSSYCIVAAQSVWTLTLLHGLCPAVFGRASWRCWLPPRAGVVLWSRVTASRFYLPLQMIEVNLYYYQKDRGSSRAVTTNMILGCFFCITAHLPGEMDATS